MKIEDYLSIPTKQKKQKRYLRLLKLVMSLISGMYSSIQGIFVIVLHKLFGYYQGEQSLIEAKTDFSIALLLLLTTVVKSFYFINFKYKSGQISLLQPSLQCKQTIVPTLIKCSLYIGLTKMGAVYMHSLEGVCIMALNLVFIEYFRIKVTRQNYNLLKQIAIIISLAAGLVLTTQQLKFTQPLTTGLFLFTFGTLSIVSFFDLNHKVFEIYKPSVQEFMAKQYITELVIYSVYVVGRLVVLNELEEVLFIVKHFPYVIMFVVMGAFSEYAVMEFLRKKKFGELIFSLFSGIGWAQIYFMLKTQNYEQRFIYGMGCFLLALIMLAEIFELKYLINGVNFLLRTERQQNRYSVD